MKFTQEKGFVSFILLIISVLVVVYLFYLIGNRYFYFSPPSEVTQNGTIQGDVNARTYQSVLDSTKKDIKDINQKLIDQSEHLFDDAVRQSK